MEKIYKRKEGIADAYGLDENDVDSGFFYSFFYKTTELSDLVKNLKVQPSLSKNSSMMTT